MKKKKEYKNQAVKKNPTIAVKQENINSWKYKSVLFIILIIALVVYLPVLNNGFVNWDDPVYILNNNLIKDFSWNGIKNIFNNFSSDNYAPMSDLISAAQYNIGGFSPTIFHLGSLGFHLLNIALVFWFIKLLTSRWELAAITSLFFGIHPMQVESVAWASARSTLFYTTFFLSSLVAYLYYLKHNKKKYLYISFLLFALSLLSKAVAAVLPFILLLFDYLKVRKITAKVLLEKIPFFMLSVGVGILSLMLKAKANAVGDLIVFPFFQRIVFACYGFTTYLFKLALPHDISAFYSYPVRNGVDIPFQYYVYVPLFLGIAALIFYSMRFSKKIIFGIGFFTIAVLPVLQLVPIGDAVMADRYSYLPCVGIFYLAAEGFNLLWNRKIKWIPILMLIVFIFFFSVTSYARCAVWKNSLTLWNNVIKQDNTIPRAFNNRGHAFQAEEKYEQALNDFSKAIELDPNFQMAYYNRGGIFALQKRYDEGIIDFSKAIELKPDFQMAYFDRGTLFSNKKEYDIAIKDYSKAIELDSNYASAFLNRADLLQNDNKTEEALKDYRKAIELKPDYAVAYYNRGVLFMNQNKNDEAVIDFSKAIKLNASYAEAYINRGNILRDENKIEEAINDYNKALQLSPDFPIIYFNRGKLFLNQKKYDMAIADFSKAIQLKPDYAKAFYNRGLAEFSAGGKDAACNDLKQAASLGYQIPGDTLLQKCK